MTTATTTASAQLSMFDAPAPLVPPVGNGFHQPGRYRVDESRGRGRGRQPVIELLSAIPAAEAPDVPGDGAHLDGWWFVTFLSVDPKFGTRYSSPRSWLLRAEHMTPVVSLFGGAS